MTDTTTDDGTDTDRAVSHTAGHVAVAELLDGSMYRIDDTLSALTHDLRTGGDVTADDVRDVRQALNRARQRLEDHVVPAVDGTESWGDPSPVARIPRDRLEELAQPAENDTDE